MNTKLKLLTAIILVGASVIGCTDKQVVPSGQKLVWTSQSSKPEWTTQSSPTIKEESVTGVAGTFYEFTGISLRHNSERVARESAIINASSNVIRYAKQLVEQEIETTYTSKNKESAVSDGTQEVIDSVSVKSTGILDHLGIVALYTEQWREGQNNFFKTYALVQIPESDLQKTQGR